MTLFSVYCTACHAYWSGREGCMYACETVLLLYFSQSLNQCYCIDLAEMCRYRSIFYMYWYILSVVAPFLLVSNLILWCSISSDVRTMCLINHWHLPFIDETHRLSYWSHCVAKKKWVFLEAKPMTASLRLQITSSWSFDFQICFRKIQ